MARPPKLDRDGVATETLTLRLTRSDRAMLDALVAHAAAELQQAGVDMTATAYVRGLIRREHAQRFGEKTTGAKRAPGAAVRSTKATKP